MCVVVRMDSWQVLGLGGVVLCCDEFKWAQVRIRQHSWVDLSNSCNGIEHGAQHKVSESVSATSKFKFCKVSQRYGQGRVMCVVSVVIDRLVQQGLVGARIVECGKMREKGMSRGHRESDKKKGY